METVRPILVLLAACYLLLSIAFIFHSVSKSDRRLAVLQAFMVIGALGWFFTELLGVFGAITFPGLAGMWGLACLAVTLSAVRAARGNFRKALLTKIREARRDLTSLPAGLLATLICVSFLMLVLGVVAFASPPNTWDSMTYHLSRVMHWEQNQSLAFYPTSIARQLHLGPLAEIFILNFQVLAGSDYLANFVQYFAMAGCLAAASLIAKLLGGDVLAQVVAMIFAATLPMAILQTVSTQTDLVVALWLSCFVALLLKQIKDGKPSRSRSLFMGMSLGLAVLTKATALLFGVSIGIWFAYWLVMRLGIKAWRELTILLGAALLINTPHFLRNYNLYENPLGPMSEAENGEYKYSNDVYNLPVLASNISRNTAIHMALPFDDFNDRIQKTIVRLHTALGIDVNDPRTTWTDAEFSVGYSTSENFAGNPLHFFLVVASFCLLAWQRDNRLRILALCLVMGALLFSFLLKWQPWHGRLHLPLFILAAPLVGVVLSGALNRRMSLAVIALLVVFALPYVFFNPAHPLAGPDNVLSINRQYQYFYSLSSNLDPYFQQAHAINELQCDEIGLMSQRNDWEYPLWVLTNAHGRDIRFEHVFVENPSGKLDTGFKPCAIVATHPVPERTLVFKNVVFVKANETGVLSLFVPSER